MKNLENLAINKWVKGDITANEMVDVLGKEESDKIILLRKTLRESVIRGVELGKKLKNPI